MRRAQRRYVASAAHQRVRTDAAFTITPPMPLMLLLFFAYCHADAVADISPLMPFTPSATPRATPRQ